MRLRSCKFLLTALRCRHETSPFAMVVGWVFVQLHCTIHHVGMSLFICAFFQICSFIAYKKGVYFRENCEREQISVVAEGLRRMRQRKKAVEALQSSHDEQHLWKCIVAFQGYRFKTISGLPFSYKIKTERNGELTKELWIDRREGSKSLTWSSVLLAFEKTEGKPLVERPKALGDIRGVSYIYGMFYRFELIEVPVKQDELRSNPTS